MSQVCDCWGLTRKKIQEAVRTHGFETADEVYEHFDGAACGVCTEEVEAIVAETLQKAAG